MLGKNEIDLSNYVKVVFYIKRYERFFDGDGCSLSAIEKLLKASENSVLNSLSVFNNVFDNSDKNQIILEGGELSFCGELLSEILLC